VNQTHYPNRLKSLTTLTLRAGGPERHLADAEKQRLIRTRSFLSKDVAAPVGQALDVGLPKARGHLTKDTGRKGGGGLCLHHSNGSWR